MDSYKKVVEYHRAENKAKASDIANTEKAYKHCDNGDEEDTDKKNADKMREEELIETEETTLMREDIQKKLETGSTRIWQDVQTKVGLLVVGSDVSELTIDQFLKLLDVIDRLIEVGTKFCQSLSPSSLSATSNSLRDSLKKQCWTFSTLTIVIG